MSQFDNPYASSGYAPTPTPGPQLPPSGMAIASLVVGIFSIMAALASGMCCCGPAPLIAGPTAIIIGLVGCLLGYLGMRETQAGVKSGHGLAMGGMITSGVGALIGLIALLVMIGFIAFATANQPPRNF